MFRLNGDVIKQLNKIYKVSFKERYRNELKERIFCYINYILSQNTFSIESIKQIEPLIAFKDNNPYKLSTLFFKQHKDALFNSFNTLWFNSSKKKQGELSFFVEEAFNEIKSNISKEELFFKINLDRFFEKEFKKISFCHKFKNQTLNETTIKNLINYLSSEINDKCYTNFIYHASDRNYFFDNRNQNKCMIGINYWYNDHTTLSPYVFFPVFYKTIEYNVFKEQQKYYEPEVIFVEKKKQVVFFLKEQFQMFIKSEFLKILNKLIKDKKWDLNFYDNSYLSELPF